MNERPSCRGDLVEALARTTSLAQQEWIAARSEARFERFRPWLEKIIQLKRQEAACLSEVADSGVPGAALYDALLDDYEPGARSAELALLFQALREELVPLVQTISEASARRTRDEEGSHGGAGAHGDAILGALIRSIDRGSLERRSPRRWVSTFSGAGWT